MLSFICLFVYLLVCNRLFDLDVQDKFMSIALDYIGAVKSKEANEQLYNG